LRRPKVSTPAGTAITLTPVIRGVPSASELGDGLVSDEESVSSPPAREDVGLRPGDGLRPGESLIDGLLIEGLTAGLSDEAAASELAMGLIEGLVVGLAEGLSRGLAEGLASGLAEGLASGLAAGLSDGLIEGLASPDG
jgi:hypothetical protein